MSWLYILSAVVAVGAAGLSDRCAAQSGGLLMTQSCLDASRALSVGAAAAAKPLGTYIANVMEGRFLALGRGEIEVAALSPVRRPPGRGNGLAAIRPGHPAVQRARRAGRLCPAAAAGLAAAQSAGAGQRQPGLGLQHRHQLRHQHQLAGLWRRIDDELPDPDAGAGGAELPVGRHRHRRRHRPDPRLRPPFGADHRQRLGRSDPRHAVCAAADCRSSSPCSWSARA